ncbi:hypothetical protein FACS18949_15310 [Clostridia bacterium]|nr:hypothetical protein FACS18949_15310 [Clostridia bacterium]
MSSGRQDDNNFLDEISQSANSGIIEIVEENKLTVAEMTGKQFLDLIKRSSLQAAQYIYDRESMHKKLLKDKIKTSQYDFEFAFVLTDSTIQKLNALVKERIATLTRVNISEIEFGARVNFSDDNSLDFNSIDELLGLTIDSLPKSIVVIWTYYQTVEYEYFDVTDTFNVPFDVSVSFNTELDGNVRSELFLVEEHGNITVEGPNYDWINSTLQQLKTVVKSTKMPPWWSVPKKYNQSSNRFFLYLFGLFWLIHCCLYLWIYLVCRLGITLF